jgi:hypothetical protein
MLLLFPFPWHSGALPVAELENMFCQSLMQFTALVIRLAVGSLLTSRKTSAYMEEYS